MNKSARVVVIGGGMAAGYLITAMCRVGHASRLTVVGSEPCLPYERPPLTKATLLNGTDDRDAELAASLPMQPQRWYTEQGVEIRTGVTAVEIDRDVRQVTLDDGTVVAYHDLVLATGGSPLIPPPMADDPRDIHVIRTRADAAALRSRLVAGARVAVVGGGFVGLEVAAAARARGCGVTVLEAGPTVLGRACTSTAADFLARAHQRRGVTIRTGTRCLGIEPGVAGVRTLLLDNGSTLHADVVVVGVGIRPAISLADAAGLEIDGRTGGVAVDEHLRATRDARVSAIGDIAAYPVRRFGARVRLESVDNAVTTAEHVAARLAGLDIPPHGGDGWTPTFWSDQYDHRLQTAGLATDYDTIRIAGDPDTDSFSVFCFAGGRLIAVESINRPSDHAAAHRALRTQMPIQPDDIKPDLDLHTLLRARPEASRTVTPR